MQDVDAAIPYPGIELIDIVFAYSNVKLVRELVQDQVRQLEETGSVSKGQAEGLWGTITSKQKSLAANLTEVEKMLEGLIDVSAGQGPRVGGGRNIQMSAEQSQAMIGAIVFAINHMSKFVPGSNVGGIGLPESMI